MHYNEEHDDVYFVWERDRQLIRCAKYRGLPLAKDLAKGIVTKRILTHDEENMTLSELAAKYPYES
jgi:hypothetical protein